MTEAQESVTRVTTPGPSEALAVLSPLVTSRALHIPADLSLEAACNLLRACHEVEEGSRFWQGDLYLAAEKQHGRDAVVAHLDAADYEALRQRIWVSERCPVDIRQPSLSWSHHRTAAGIGDPEDVLLRASWLQRAADEEWSVADLKRALKGEEAQGPRKVDRERVLSLIHDAVGRTWTADHESAVRAAMGED